MLSREINSGRQLRLDFAGRLETISEDWERLKPALELKASLYTPLERRLMILPRAHANNDIKHHRSTSNNSVFVPFSETEKFSLLHVILVCRRFVQDLVCFEFDVPQVCIDHAELVLDLQS